MSEPGSLLFERHGGKEKSIEESCQEGGHASKRRGVKLTPTELSAPELAVSEPPAELSALLERVKTDGGAVLGVYREPLGRPLTWRS